jgi:nucleotide-binding universal stress UspA family protein
MPFGRIIVPTSGTRLLDHKLEIALSVAGYFGSSIEVLFLRGTVDPQTVEHDAFSGEPAWEMAEIRWADEQPKRDEVEAYSRKWLAERHVPEWTTPVQRSQPSFRFIDIDGPYKTVLEEHGRTSDLVIIGQPGKEMTASEAEINKLSVTASARIVLIVPNGPKSSGLLLKRAIIAWDGGIRASRLVALAMPLLQAAEGVTVYSVGSGAEFQRKHDLIQNYLDRNNISANYVVERHSSARIGKYLLEAGDRCGASLVCMGAYENPRALERLIGGNTRYVYFQSGIPALFSF